MVFFPTRFTLFPTIMEVDRGLPQKDSLPKPLHDCWEGIVLGFGEDMKLLNQETAQMGMLSCQVLLHEIYRELYPTDKNQRVIKDPTHTMVAHAHTQTHRDTDAHIYIYMFIYIYTDTPPVHNHAWNACTQSTYNTAGTATEPAQKETRQKQKGAVSLWNSTRGPVHSPLSPPKPSSAAEFLAFSLNPGVLRHVSFRSPSFKTRGPKKS